jgi:hypothetical protein
MRAFFQDRGHRTVLLIWAGWVVVLLAYQAFVPARLELARPDYALSWTPKETAAGSQLDKIYLNDPFLNSHVSWDSEFYLAISIEGYDSWEIRRVNGLITKDQTLAEFWPFGLPESAAHGAPLSMSLAFLPGYPLTMRAVSVPLGLLGMNTIATASLAGVVVSALGTLAGMLALYELAKDELGEDGGLRAAFYFVIFPSGFFLLQIYTEGLFVGLVFWALVLMRRGRLGWAAALVLAATFTRALGLTLMAPLAYHWWRAGEWKQFTRKKFRWSAVGRVLLLLSPVIAFGIWKLSYYGLAFSVVEDVWFGRGLLELGKTHDNWLALLQTFSGENTQAAVYSALELAGLIFGLVTCFIGARKHPDLAMFGFAVVFLSFTSGQPQGMYRYILAAPPVFTALARWGKNAAFDRVWTLASVLLMGVMATLFTFDLWAG